MATPALNIPFKPALNARPGDNLAPKKPLLELKLGTPKTPTKFTEALRDIAKDKLKTNKSVFENLYRAGYMVANFIEGNQIGKVHPTIPGAMLSWTPAAGDTESIRQINLMRFWATNNLWKWLQSNPDIRARAARNTDEALEAAEAADVITDHYERKFWKSTVSTQEALQGMCWGTYVERFRWDDSRPSLYTAAPIYEQQLMTLGTGWGMCGSCGFQSEANNFQQVQQNPDDIPMDLCPECGQFAHVTEPASGVVPVQTGERPVALGDFVHELLPFVECRWDLSRSVQESSWFIHQREVTVASLHRLLGDVEINGSTEEDPGLAIAEKLAWLKQGIGGNSSGLEPVVNKSGKARLKATVIEMSLGPDDLADIVIDEDTETLSGGKLRKGPAINMFPDGGTFQGINLFDITTGVFLEHHSETTVSGIWHAKAMSGTGQGLHDSVELQRVFNSSNSQIMNFNRSMGTPAMLVLADVLDATDKQEYIGTPGINIPVTGDQLGDRKLSDVCAPAFPPASVPSQFYDFTYQRLADMFQMLTMNTDMAGGNLPGNNPRTKYGTQVKQSNAHALFTPPLLVKAETRVALMDRLLVKYPKHFPMERTFMLKGKYGRQIGRSFAGANLGNDIVLESVKDSELPRNSVTKQDDLSSFFAICGGLPGYIEMAEKMPKRLQEIEQIFNVQLDTEPIIDVNSLCLQRIRQMQQLAPMVDDPQILLLNIQPPVSREEPSQELKATSLSEWLDQDDAQEAPPVLRTAVELLIEIHREGQGMQMMQMAYQQGQVQTAQAAPGAIAQMAHGVVQNQIQPPQPPPEEANGQAPAA